MKLKQKYQNGWITQFVGAGLVIIALVGYAWPMLVLFFTGKFEWAAWLVVTMPSGLRVDFGPAIVGTVGFLVVFLGRRARKDAYAQQYLLLTKLAEDVRASGDPQDLALFETEKALFVTFNKKELLSRYIYSGFNVFILVLLILAALWLFLEIEDVTWLAWIPLVAAVLLAIRTWADWPSRQTD